MSTLPFSPAPAKPAGPNDFADWLDGQVLGFKPVRTSDRHQFVARLLSSSAELARFYDARTPAELDRCVLEAEYDHDLRMETQGEARAEGRQPPRLKPLCVVGVPAGPDDDTPVEF